MFRTANTAKTAAISSLRRFSSKTGKGSRRTVVRDPRKKKIITPTSAVKVREDTEIQQTPVTPPAAPFAPSGQNQERVGSTLGSYALAGVGMTLGFTLVKVVFGI